MHDVYMVYRAMHEMHGQERSQEQIDQNGVFQSF